MINLYYLPFVTLIIVKNRVMGGNDMPRRGENIYKRKDGRWEGRYIKKHINGKAKYGYVYAKSYKEVRERLSYAKKLYAESEDDGKLLCSTNHENKFCDMAYIWLNYKKSVLKDSSFIKYNNLLNSYLIPQFGDELVENITYIKVENFVNMLLVSGGKNCKGLSPKTVQSVISILKSVLSYASNNNFKINISPNNITIKQEQKILRVLSTHEQTRLTNYIYSNLNNTNIGILISLYTGLRIGELCSLKWSDILWNEHCISIEKTMQRLQNIEPTDKKTTIIISEPKSSYSIRKIPLPEELYNILVKYRGKYDTYVLTSTRLFVEPRTMQYRFKGVLKKCNINNATFHTLRHTFATRCIELGFDVKSLSEILGHANVNITLNRYVHPSMEQKQKNMNLFCDLLSVK